VITAAADQGSEGIKCGWCDGGLPAPVTPALFQKLSREPLLAPSHLRLSTNLTQGIFPIRYITEFTLDFTYGMQFANVVPGSECRFMKGKNS
jgi:hypothetical protein